MKSRTNHSTQPHFLSPDYQPSTAQSALLIAGYMMFFLLFLVSFYFPFSTTPISQTDSSFSVELNTQSPYIHPAKTKRHKKTTVKQNKHTSETASSKKTASTKKTSETILKVEPAPISAEAIHAETDVKVVQPAEPINQAPKIDYDIENFVIPQVFDLKNYMMQFVAQNPDYTIEFDSQHHYMRLQRNSSLENQAGVQSMMISFRDDLETNNPNSISISVRGVCSSENPSLKYRRDFYMPTVWGELIRIDGCDEYFYTAQAVVLKDVLAAMVEHPTGDDITESGTSPLYSSLRSSKFQE